ncbi:MAG: UDP-3-O-acyl-N-acetylglucosamine deacetylase [Synergistaceae bacterium]|nr:UDP-3-O-acyl-N-acetylglucosamine deacetylase [Synergistaceae bacterium]
MRINGKIILKGAGLHSGRECELIIEPCDSPEIIIGNGEDFMPISRFKTNGTNRGSDYIFTNGDKIMTCEHVLSGLAGLDIFSGLKLTINGGEMPALDGCAERVCSEIMKCSDSDYDSESESLNAIEVNQPVIIYGDDDKKRFIAAFPNRNKLHITYTVEYKYIGCQVFDYIHSPENYINEISRARTFAYESDIEYLRSHGMALGGSLDNAVLIRENEIKASGGLRFKNEFVRHKILDLIGDLASLGKKINAHIIALRAGHELHLKLAEMLKHEGRKNS